MTWCNVFWMWCKYTNITHTGQSPSSSTTTTKCCKVSKKIYLYSSLQKYIHIFALLHQKKLEFHPRPFFPSSTPKKPKQYSFLYFFFWRKKMMIIIWQQCVMLSMLMRWCHTLCYCCCCADADITYQKKYNTLYTFYFAYSEKTVLSFPPDFFLKKKEALHFLFLSFCYHIPKITTSIAILCSPKPKKKERKSSISSQKTYFL